MEKLALTPIADCEAAVSKTETLKTAATDEIAPIYSKDIDLNQYRGLMLKVAAEVDKQEFLKTASVKKPEVKKIASLDKLFSDKRSLEVEIKKLAGSAQNTKDRLEGSFYILEKAANKVSDAERLATKLAVVNNFGKEALTMIDDYIRVEQPTMKLASANKNLLEIVEDIVEDSDKLRDTLEVLDKVAKCRNMVIAEIDKRVGVNRPPKEAGFFDPSMWGKVLVVDKINDSLKPESKGQPENLNNALPSRFVQHGIVTPEHKRNIDSIKIKSMMNDMMSNDEIISQYDPEEVQAVFNELRATAPDAMNKPSVARSFIREALAKGSLGSYDLNPLMSYNKT